MLKNINCKNPKMKEKPKWPKKRDTNTKYHIFSLNNNLPFYEILYPIPLCPIHFIFIVVISIK